MEINDSVITTQKQNKIYKIRRVAQKLTGRILGPVFTTKTMYRIAKGHSIDLKDPKTFSEKICWYKLYYCPKNELIVKCADKYLVREYAQTKGISGYLNTLLGVWDKAEDIEWEQLPQKFAIKCSHGCAYNIICMDKERLNTKDAERTLNHWLNDDFGYYNGEPHYNLGKRRIICEEYINSKDRLPVDYKIHCMNGEPKIVQECYDRANGKTMHHFYSLDGIPVMIGKENASERINIQDDLLREMVELSRIIAADFPYVRVDCYINKGEIKLGELTFSPGAGILGSLSDEGEIQMGSMLDLSECLVG